MSKKKKSIEDHLKAIQYLLVGLLLKRDVNIKKLAKIIGVSDKEITKMYPQKKQKGKAARGQNEQ